MEENHKYLLCQIYMIKVGSIYTYKKLLNAMWIVVVHKGLGTHHLVWYNTFACGCMHGKLKFFFFKFMVISLFTSGFTVFSYSKRCVFCFPGISLSAFELFFFYSALKDRDMTIGKIISMLLQEKKKNWNWTNFRPL